MSKISMGPALLKIQTDKMVTNQADSKYHYSRVVICMPSGKVQDSMKLTGRSNEGHLCGSICQAICPEV